MRELTGGLGAHSVLECVGLEQAVVTALEIARPGGAIGRVGVPEHDTTPTGIAFWKNVSVGGGPAPGARLHRGAAAGRARRADRARPRLRSHRTLDDVPDGYRAMDDRDVLKFQIAF